MGVHGATSFSSGLDLHPKFAGLDSVTGVPAFDDQVRMTIVVGIADQASAVFCTSVIAAAPPARLNVVTN